MSKEIKLIVDSVFEDLVRITMTANGERRTIDIDIEALGTILEKETIVDGRSYLITFEDSDDSNNLISGMIGRRFRPKGKVSFKDTTKKDLAKIRKLQRKLGLRSSR